MFMSVDYRDSRYSVLMHAYLRLCCEVGLHDSVEPEVLAYRHLLSSASKLTIKGEEWINHECDCIAPQLREILSI